METAARRTSAGIHPAESKSGRHIKISYLALFQSGAANVLRFSAQARVPKSEPPATRLPDNFFNHGCTQMDTGDSTTKNARNTKSNRSPARAKDSSPGLERSDYPGLTSHKISPLPAPYPNGVISYSPGLRGTSYPGNPNQPKHSPTPTRLPHLPPPAVNGNCGKQNQRGNSSGRK